jgi:hypothetical protein
MSRVLLLLLFAAVVIATPVQYIVKQKVSEPYPGLFQPAFGGVPSQSGILEERKPQIDVAYADGSSRAFTHQELLYDSGVQSLSVFNSGFYRDKAARARHPETTAWLKERVEELGNGSMAREAVITRVNTKYSTTGAFAPQSQVVDEMRVVFQEAR